MSAKDIVAIRTPSVKHQYSARLMRFQITNKTGNCYQQVQFRFCSFPYAACYTEANKHFEKVTNLHERVVDMATLLFVATLVAGGVILSLIPCDTLSSRADQPDYHYVPYAGDAFGHAA